ncbi:hypothetical protein [Amycolatopsis sp. cmx-11-51]|uniref:hypothetical protein n=1 Tax=unclassified Amycolatopsis TaxID=2618356 RepID=UPI0039E5AF1D
MSPRISAPSSACAPSPVARLEVRHHLLAIQGRSARLLRLAGVRPDSAWLVVDDEFLWLRFSHWTARIPVTSLTAVQVRDGTRCHPRLRWTRRRLTMVTAPGRRVRIVVSGSVPDIPGWGVATPREITVTPERPYQLARRLRQHIDAATFTTVDRVPSPSAVDTGPVTGSPTPPGRRRPPLRLVR